jgi:enterochelin esterase family protein
MTSAAPVRPSPDVHADGSVTLAIYAPDATSVKVDSDFRLGQQFVAPIMATDWPGATRDADGWWSVTSEPMEPGVYRYKFVVDGFKTLDPQNGWMRKAAIGQPFNMVVVPGAGAQPWDIDPSIAHGTVVRHVHQSELLGAPRYLNVYLPAGYDPAATYPVLYLLHGGGNDYGHWVFDGTADLIMDTLIARGVLPPTIVVMPDGNVNDNSRFPGSVRAGSAPDWRERMAEVHPKYFIGEVIPLAESLYKLDGQNRAIAGLSMGCMQVWRLLCTSPEYFTAAGLFSGTADMADLDGGPGETALKQYRTVFVGVGDWDVERLHSSMTEAPGLLAERGIPSTGYTTQGGHTWSVWQRCLVEFAADLKAHGWVSA